MLEEAVLVLALANIIEVVILSIYMKKKVEHAESRIEAYTSPQKMHENAEILAEHIGPAVSTGVSALTADIGEMIGDQAQEAMLSFAGKQMKESGKDANAVDSMLKVAYREAGVNNLDELVQGVQSGNVDISKILGPGAVSAQPGQAMMNPMQLIAGLLPKKYRPYLSLLGGMGQMGGGGGGQPASGGGPSNSGSGNLW